MGIGDIKKRTKAVKNTLQITKAMELIASIKMRAALAACENSRLFTREANLLLNRLAREGKIYRNQLLTNVESDHSLLVVASSDKGLCGSFNTEIFSSAWQFIEVEESENRQVEIIAIGQKAGPVFLKSKKVEIIANFNTLGEDIEYPETTAISKLIIDEFKAGKYAKVAVAYSEFKSVIKQEAKTTTILPIVELDLLGAEELASDQDKKRQYEFEPDPTVVLDMVLPQLVRMRLFQALLENNVSEHAARMVAMKNATDAGKEIVEDLEFTYNRLRQERITTELSEIASGAQAT